MFCSIVIPTIGRASVARTIQSIFDQRFSPTEFEIIVVNDTGQPLADDEWQSSPHIQVLTTNRRERCIARNAGAAVARGQFLCFLDDDDWLLPGALAQFRELANRTADAVWLYGGLQVVDENGTCLAEANSNLNGNCFAQIMGGAWAPIQASFIRTQTFFEVGGYNPAIIGTEDLDLARRIAFQGNFANTPAMVACLLRGETWSTSTNYQRAPEDTLHSRDDILNEPGTFNRMLQSANSSYWYGRILRIYLSTIKFNLNRRHLTLAASRAIHALATLILAGKHIFAPDFWQAVRAHHVPGTLHFIMQALEQ